MGHSHESVDELYDKVKGMRDSAEKWLKSAASASICPQFYGTHRRRGKIDRVEFRLSCLD